MVSFYYFITLLVGGIIGTRSACGVNAVVRGAVLLLLLDCWTTVVRCTSMAGCPAYSLFLIPLIGPPWRPGGNAVAPRWSDLSPRSVGVVPVVLPSLLHCWLSFVCSSISFSGRCVHVRRDGSQ